MSVMFPSNLEGGKGNKKVHKAVQGIFWVIMSHTQSMTAGTGELCSRFLTLKSQDVTTSKTIKHKPVMKIEVRNIFLEK